MRRLLRWRLKVRTVGGLASVRLLRLQQVLCPVKAFLPSEHPRYCQYVLIALWVSMESCL